MCIKYNNIPEGRPERQKVLKEIFPQADDTVFVRGPVYVDYGLFTKIGKNTYFNFSLVILDVCPVTIGDNCFFGPNVSIMTAIHSLIAEERRFFYSEEKSHMNMVNQLSLVMIAGLGVMSRYYQALQSMIMSSLERVRLLLTI